jgi:hypothetical protein
VPNRLHQSWLNELTSDVDYSVEIKVVKSKRSIAQNKLLWSLLHMLEKETKELAMDWYIKALIDTGAIVDYIWCADRTEDTVMKSFRAIQKMKYEKMKNVDGYWYRVIVGSSKFNITEMNELIDTVLRYCAEHNIDTELLKYEEVK